MKITLILMMISTLVQASSLSIDIGQTQAVFNRFSIPNKQENRISLPTRDKLTSYRVTGYYDLDNGNQLYVLIAPLETSYNFKADKNFEFDGQNYSSGIDTDVNYKFNSYRLGYLWRWKFKGLNLWSGVVGKIRDAKIEVKQNGIAKSFDNVGFVPLASVGAELFFTRSFSLFSHTDALGASQGSAYDSQLELRLRMSSLALSFGKRVLGGGADNDNVYNFAQFDTYYSRLTFFL